LWPEEPTLPEVDAPRIGLMGTRKGAEFALSAGTRMPWIRASRCA
jgi:hypothetical protein